MMARVELVDEVNGEDYVHPSPETQFTSRHLYLLPEAEGIPKKYFPFEVFLLSIYIKMPYFLISSTSL